MINNPISAERVSVLEQNAEVARAHNENPVEGNISCNRS